jgi:hypothetical protein
LLILESPYVGLIFLVRWAVRLLVHKCWRDSAMIRVTVYWACFDKGNGFPEMDAIINRRPELATK